MGTEAPTLRRDKSMWGPWQTVLEDAVAACTHHVRNLGAAISGDVEVTRDEFWAEAARLYESAYQLMERRDDIASWPSISEGGEDDAL